MTRIFSLNFHILTPKLKFAMEEISMKATGIVRRIDDLGRVVVPKEIRRTLRIREGDPMEIFTNHDGEIYLRNIHLLERLKCLQNNMQMLWHRFQDREFS